jgi:hypothetical protein
MAYITGSWIRVFGHYPLTEVPKRPAGSIQTTCLKDRLAVEQS